MIAYFILSYLGGIISSILVLAFFSNPHRNSDTQNKEGNCALAADQSPELGSELLRLISACQWGVNPDENPRPIEVARKLLGLDKNKSEGIPNHETTDCTGRPSCGLRETADQG